MLRYREMASARWAGLAGCCAALVLSTGLTPSVAGETKGLVAPGAEVKKLSGGFAFTEGPASDSKGNVYFSDIPNERIHRWSVDGKLTTVREDSGRANGLFFDDEGNLLACEGGNGRLTKMAPDGTVTVLVAEYDGKPFNSPNDLWIDPKGGVYFTDPYYGPKKPLPQDGQHVYYLPPGKDEAIRVIDDMVRPNGVIGTKDGKYLYVADHGGDKTYRYTISADGTLGDKKLHAPQGSDGMTLDERGNLYLTKGAVQVYSPSGEKIETISFPEGPANVTFSGPDGKTLYVTARTGFYSLDMAVGAP